MSITETLNKQSSRHLMLIGGRWREAVSGQWFTVENPARREIIGEVPLAGSADVDIAVHCATSAFEAWRRVPARDRGRQLLRIADRLESCIEELAKIVASETGNALRTQSRPEAKISADIFRYFGGLASELKGDTIPLDENVLSYTRREPLGVVGAIIPWNSPLLLACLKIAPALCAGNTIVLKTAEDAPLAVLLMAELCQEFLPEGVLNVLTGSGADCGAALINHPGIAKLSFTGSTQVGKLVMQAAVERVLSVSLELGGKNPSIVFPDADHDWVVDGVITGMRFTRQSQSCTAGSRLYVHRDIHESFLERLIEKTAAFRIGDPLDESTDVGAMINEKQFRRVCNYIEEGMRHPTARLLTGGIPESRGAADRGFYMKPTVFLHDSNDWRLAREEIFGPVLVVVPWDDEAEVIRMANDSHYGLAAYVWSRDISKALRAAHRIHCGWIQVNQGGGQSLGQSYGGYKQSGLGREFSLQGMLDSFTQTKNVTVNLTHYTDTI